MLQASTNSATRFGLIWDIGWFVGILPDSFRFFTTVYSITWLSCLHVDTSWLTKLGRLQVRQGIDRDSRGWDVSRSVEILLLFEILWSVLGYFEIVSSVSWYLGILKKKKHSHGIGRITKNRLGILGALWDALEWLKEIVWGFGVVQNWLGLCSGILFQDDGLEVKRTIVKKMIYSTFEVGFKWSANI